MRFILLFCRCFILGAIAFLLGGVALILQGEELPPQAARVLTTIKEVKALLPEVALRGVPVRVRGIVTRATPYELFIQEGPDAIFVWQQENHPGYRMGDYAEISGSTHSGSFSPVIKAETITVLEHRTLPVPHQVHFYDLSSGREDCQWVEVEGVVRTAEEKPWGDLTLMVALDGASLRAEVVAPVTRVPAQLVGARVRLRGVVGGSKTPQRQIIEPVLWVTYMPETFSIEIPAPSDVFSAPIKSVAALIEYGGNLASGEMARVIGSVTSQPSSNLIFVRDGAHSMEIRLQQAMSVAPGDQIEAVGFPEMGAIQPILQNAFIRTMSAGPAPHPFQVGAKQLLDFRHEADLVRIEGELRELYRRETGIMMVVSDGGLVFGVDVDKSTVDSDAEIPSVGSRLSLVGICQIDRLSPPDRFQLVTPVSFRLRLHSLADLQVLSKPSWWTPQRLLFAVALLSAFILGALGWIWSLNRRVHAQTQIILRNVQKGAMLEERNRIARELHDTLEQQLAGATILLDAIATVLTEQPERARDGLNTARAMLRHSLDEAQEAVSDLRHDDLFERELQPLIEDSVRERLQSTSIAVNFHCEGIWPDLDTVVKKHILRIVQESVTNAIKHASATSITIVMLAAHDRIELHVVDNGGGFEVQDRKRRGPGEFGLIGLRERAEKIGAKLLIQSSPQRGTSVVLSLSRNGVAQNVNE